MDEFSILERKRARFQLPKMNDKVIVVLAPHADDEIIGCGGILCKLRQEQCTVFIVLFTQDGWIREQEFKIVSRKLNYKGVYFINQEDGKLSQGIIQGKNMLEDILKELSPDIVFVPYIFDFVDDHFAANRILYEVLKQNCTEKNKFQILMYEVWGLMNYPQYYIDISDKMSEKVELLKYYKSQEQKYSIVSKSIKINGLRAELSFRKKVAYMECFKEISMSQYLGTMKKLIT